MQAVHIYIYSFVIRGTNDSLSLDALTNNLSATIETFVAHITFIYLLDPIQQIIIYVQNTAG